MEVVPHVTLILVSKVQMPLGLVFLLSGTINIYIYIFRLDGLLIHILFVFSRVTLILYQNIVPISLYISVEIVKTVAVRNTTTTKIDIIL